MRTALLIPLLLLACSKPEIQAVAIGSAFVDYRTAAVALNGPRAVQSLSQRTIDAFETLRQTSLTGDGDTIRALPMIERLLVATIRVQIDAETLSSMDGRGLLVHTINEGMVSEQGLSVGRISNIQVDGDSASADFVSRGQTAPVLHFYREDDVWKWDMMPTLAHGGEALEEQARQAGMNLDEVIFMNLSSLAGRPINGSIYDTPLHGSEAAH